MSGKRDSNADAGGQHPDFPERKASGNVGTSDSIRVFGDKLNEL